MQNPDVTSRSHYRQFYSIETRWMDNDQYGHINNVTYYSFFDTAVNKFLIEKGGLDTQSAPIVGYVVHSNCHYVSSLAYPAQIEVGIKVIKLGNSSVTYGVGVFSQGKEQASAHGEFVHVFVDRASNKSVPIPDGIRHALSTLE